MNKEQQIKEMAQTMCEFAHSIGKCDCVNSFAPNCTWKDMATSVYNTGYRKLPEDSVVLSREEYERLVKTAQGKIGNMKLTDFLKACISSGVMVEAVSTEEQVKQAYEKGCKETAEQDFYTIIKALEERKERIKAFYGVAESAGVDIAIRTVKELAKQFGVEIKE